jgi:glycosyltransferase involved in cell wall biosynthesis
MGSPHASPRSLYADDDPASALLRALRDHCGPMRFSIVSIVPPASEGGPPHRALLALGDGLVADGHDVDCWVWGPEQPREELPAWARWERLPPEPQVRTRVRALVRPRHDTIRMGWEPPPDAVALADMPVSYAAVHRSPHSAVTFHYLSRFDVPALRFPTGWDIQNLRSERNAARHAKVVFAYSERVAQVAKGRAHVVPIAYPMPTEALPPRDQPVALLLANWEWPPNAKALTWMLEVWPDVRPRVPGAELVLAGWGLDRMGVSPGPGVRVVGSVARSIDALAEASVLAFPCPPTSGPKTKVLEALSYGLPVVTTEYGVEGLWLERGEGAVVTDRAGFGAALADLLVDPERRRELATTGRAAMVTNHSGQAAARARVAVCARAFGLPV